jgi:signal transduction histidine kinase
MFGRPSLRRRLIVSYLAVVLVVTAAAFVTVEVLVPQFFEQGVQQRFGNGTDGSQPGNENAPGRTGSTDGTTGNPTGTTGNPTGTTTSTGPGAGDTGTSTSAPRSNPTGSTIGPGAPGADGSGSGTGGDQGGDGRGTGTGNGNGQPGGTDAGHDTGGDANAATWTGAAPGIVAAAPVTTTTADTERVPVPTVIQEEYDKALTTSLLVAIGIGLLIALGLGYFFSGRVLRTIGTVNRSAERLAAGHYDVRVPEPREAELAELAVSVNTLADSLSRTEQFRARLVSDLAHEIRNPLSTIEGYMEGLIDGVLPAERETYEAVAREAHRLQRLTRDLSTLSKAQEGELTYAREPVDLAAAAQSVVEALRMQFELNDVSLHIDLDEELPVTGDPDRLAQALTNLLGNALGHTPPGGQVQVAGGAEDATCAIAIRDSGEGIPPEQLEPIFDRFTRLDPEQPGTGIGLNIARTLIRGQGGDVTATSDGPGLGATFTLRLPRRS